MLVAVRQRNYTDVEYNSINSQDVCITTYTHTYVYSVFELAMCACKHMGKVLKLPLVWENHYTFVYACMCAYLSEYITDLQFYSKNNLFILS